MPPGSGWPGDPATPATPAAHDPASVRTLAVGARTLPELMARQSVCRACPRLVEWREQVARARRRSSRTEQYWGRPVPGWGDEQPRILIVGLAPAAHGGNRTGRIFTGDRSGDVLFASLHRCGLAALPTSTSAGDEQRLTGVRMAAAVRCAPPANKPSVTERDTCAPWLVSEFALVSGSVRVVVSLGAFAWHATWATLRSAGFTLPRPRPAFGHGAEVLLPGRFTAKAGAPGAGGVPSAAGSPSAGQLAARAVPSVAGSPSGGLPAAGSSANGGGLLLIGCYHPSQQNTFTGRVTPAMLDAVFQRARSAAALKH